MVFPHRYHEITSEVLTSVKRTEDSLLKLRRNRQSLLPTSGMSDDNKIRLQIALDIETFCSKVSQSPPLTWSCPLTFPSLACPLCDAQLYKAAIL